MSWQSLALVTVMFMIAVSMLFIWVWPRNQDGTFMSLDEVEKLMKKFPQTDSGRTKSIIVGVFATLGMIGVALTRRGRDHRNDDFDD
jgi:hypothetical protein